MKMEDDFTKYLTAASKKIAASQQPTVNIDESISQLEHKISQLESKISSRSIWLKHTEAYDKTIDDLIRQIDGITKSIDQTYQKNKELSESSHSNSTLFARNSKLHSGNNQVPGLESPCMRSVRETCETISSYFTKEYHHNAGLPNEQTENEEETTKDYLWVKAEEIFNNFNAKEIQTALLSNIQESTTNLNDLCSHIDLKKDADNLKFMFETGKLKDVSTKPALMRTVHQLIEEGQVKHFKRFLACEKAQNESWKLEKKLTMLNESINQTLATKFDTEKAGQVRELFSLEQENQTYSSSLHYLQNEMMKLRTERQEKEHAVAILMKKLNRIQNFDKTTQGKQLVIQQLVKNNGSSKARHRQQHQDIVTSAQQKILKCQEELPDLCRRYQQLREEEIEHYTDTPVSCLQTVNANPTKRQLVSELSIYRTDPKYTQQGTDYLKSISKDLRVLSHESAENILPAILHSKNEVYRAEKEEEEDLHDEMLATIAKVTGIQETICQSREEDINSSLPTLKESQRLSHDIMTESMKLRNAVQSWWEQPAQHVVPWLTEDDYNVTQYLDQFSSRSSLLKKIQLVN